MGVVRRRKMEQRLNYKHKGNKLRQSPTASQSTCNTTPNTPQRIVASNSHIIFTETTNNKNGNGTPQSTRNISHSASTTHTNTSNTTSNTNPNTPHSGNNNHNHNQNNTKHKPNTNHNNNKNNNHNNSNNNNNHNNEDQLLHVRDAGAAIAGNMSMEMDDFDHSRLPPQLPATHYNDEFDVNECFWERPSLIIHHIFWMSFCDVFVCIWSIALFGPKIFAYEGASNNEYTCYLYGILVQFAICGSVIWYLIIAWCLFVVLFNIGIN